MKKFILPLAVLCIAGGALILFIRSRTPDPVVDKDAPNTIADQATQAMSAENALRLSHRHHEGVAALENHDLPAAIAAFEEVVRAAPDEVGALQNLAIARTMEFDASRGQSSTAGPAGLVAAPDAALRAIEGLESLQQDSAAAHFLRGRVAELQADADRATAEFYAAAEVADKNPGLAGRAAALFNTAFIASQAPGTDKTKALGEQALQRAAAAAPENIYLWLFVIVQQARNRQQEFAATLDAQRHRIELIAADVQKTSRTDPLKLLDDAKAAAAAADWSRAQSYAQQLANIVKPHDMANSDKVYATSAHPLDFVQARLSEALRHRAETGRTAASLAGVGPFAVSTPAAESSLLDVALCDFDLDGDLEAALLFAGRLEVRQIPPAGDGEWTLITAAEVAATMTEVELFDLDDDADAAPAKVQSGAERPDETEVSPATACRSADVDVGLYGAGGIALLENRLDSQTGARSLVIPQPPEVPSVAGDVPPQPPAANPALLTPANVTSLIAADLSLDGDLDVLFATPDGLQVCANRALWNFAEPRPLLPSDELSTGVVAMTAVDWDRDIDIDVLVVTRDGGVYLLENLRHFTFRVRLLPGEAVAGAAALTVAEVDGNVSWDLLLAGSEGTHAFLTDTPYRNRVDVREAATLTTAAATGLIDADVNNDGFVDVLTWSGAGASIIQPHVAGEKPLGEPGLTPVTAEPVEHCAVGDLDADGDLDVLAISGGELRRITNETPAGGRSFSVTLAAQHAIEKQGGQTRRVNHYAVGSTIELTAGTHYQAQVVRAQSTHFGIGESLQPDAVRVTWTNGFPQNIMNPQAGMTICEVETPKGSCPFLYTWNGDEFIFVTDLCWAAPLGLQTADGGLMPCDSEEYILIRGDELHPRDGKYVLQLTAELWEADYFDRVELIAIDHPADVQVVSNEKVGPPSINEFGVHTVRSPIRPVSAINHSGRDLLAEVAARDQVYARPFDDLRMQGYTTDSWLELDFGALPDPGRTTLFLTGWLFPTDTSINVALAEDPYLDGPRPPALLVPDEQGEWREVLPFMGFPGGKTKTIAVDLSGKFLSDDHRIRVATSQELYWDEIFVTSGEAPAECQLSPLAPQATNLHYRGFSRRVPQPHHAPPVFDYADVRTERAWPTMAGRFTRYGDVSALVMEADDQMVVMHSGDELTIEFAAAAPPPAGWTRDFFLHTHGWDKDADLNTIYGQSSEPLPFHAMSGYPYAADEHFPDNEAHRDYLRTYQTRTVDDTPFRRLVKNRRTGQELVSP